MSFQQIILVGNLGRDPEMRYTPTGVPVTTFSVAVSRSWTDQNGTRQEKTHWFRVTAWRKLAETVSQYATKGSRVLVVGEVEEPRIWTDREGQARTSLEVTAQNVRFIGPRADGGSSVEAGIAPAERTQDGEGGHLSEEDIPF